MTEFGAKPLLKEVHVKYGIIANICTFCKSYINNKFWVPKTNLLT
jgi:hypothetical protein